MSDRYRFRAGAPRDDGPDDAWTREEDDLVRAALMSLREDVDHAVLPPAAAVESRGSARRRSRWLVGAAGVAAAGLAAAAVGFSGLGRPSPDQTDPASRTSSTSAASTTSRSTGPDYAALLAASDAPLPTAAEWGAALGLSAEPSLSRTDKFDAPVCATARAPGAPGRVEELRVTAGDGGSFAFQAVWTLDSEDAATAAANVFVEGLQGCAPHPTLTDETTDAYSEHPMMWSFADPDGNAGWVSVTQRGREIGYIEIWGKPNGVVTQNRFARLVNVLENRLETYGAGSSPTGSSTGGAGTPTGPEPAKSIAGPPGSIPAESLFIDPRAVASKILTGGDATEAGGGDFEGSPQVSECDADTRTDGRFGIMLVQNTGTGSFFVTERIRSFVPTETEPQGLVDAYVTQLTDGFQTCSASTENMTTTAEAGPTSGTFKLTTTFKDQAPTLVDYVAVTPLTTPGHVATVVIKVSDYSFPGGLPTDAQAFAELDRLTALASRR